VKVMFKVRIRGIYATALTKLLLDEGFEIVQPSYVIEERFNFNSYEVSKPLDIDIFDRGDRQGVYALCTNKSHEALRIALQNNLLDVVVREWRVQVGGVYKGLVKHVDLSGRTAFVQITDDVTGVLYSSKPIPKDLKEMLVQVEKRNFGSKCPVLSDQIKLAGRYAVLVPGGRVKVSRRIRDPSKRSYLIKLGEAIKPEGWGIIWRTAAGGASEDELKSEIEFLIEKWRKLMELSNKIDAPALVLEGQVVLNIEFPHESKRTLDEIRSRVVPTIPGHHFYKAFSPEVSVSVDMAEKLLSRGEALSDVREKFLREFIVHLPSEGQMISIKHVKLSGKEINLGKALIEEFNEETGELKLRRIILGRGTYDGLNIEKSPGDYAITEAKIGEWFLKTTYYSHSGEVKGMYININTPIELYSNYLRYVDLEVDVCITREGEVKILDEEKLIRSHEMGIISRRLVERVRNTVNRILSEVAPKIAASLANSSISSNKA